MYALNIIYPLFIAVKKFFQNKPCFVARTFRSAAKKVVGGLFKSDVAYGYFLPNK